MVMGGLQETILAQPGLLPQSFSSRGPRGSPHTPGLGRLASGLGVACPFVSLALGPELCTERPPVGAGDSPVLPPSCAAPCPAQKSWKSRPCPLLRRTLPPLPPPRRSARSPSAQVGDGRPLPLASSLGRSPHPVPSMSIRRCSQGARWPRSYDIKCSCTETWPQSNYTRKQEEPLRLIWLFCLGLPRQRRRDAQEGQLSGWAAA